MDYFSVYSMTKAGVNAMTEDLDLVEEVERAPDLIQSIFKNETLAYPDDSRRTIEQNTKSFKTWVIQFFFDGHFKKHFGFTKVSRQRISETIHTSLDNQITYLSHFNPIFCVSAVVGNSKKICESMHFRKFVFFFKDKIYKK